MNSACLKLDVVRLDGGTQCRAALSQDYIADLAEAWQGGAKIPAVVVFYDGSNYWLADGFHRYHAAQKCGFLDIEVEVRSGTRTDAVRYALGANAAHGQPRTNADKRRAVEIALKEFPKLSSAELARICAVSHTFVDKARPVEVATVASCEKRTGADGKSYPVKKPARVSQALPIETAPTMTPERAAEIAAYRATFKRPVAKLSPEAQAAIEATKGESVPFFQLKYYWGEASKRDRSAFLEWIKNQETKK